MYVTLGPVDTGDGESFFKQLNENVEKLENGFTCVSDISNFSFNDPGETVWVDKAIQVLADAGMVKVVRVTGSEVKNRETTEKLGYKVGLAKNVEDADKILDEI